MKLRFLSEREIDFKQSYSRKRMYVHRPCEQNDTKHRVSLIDFKYFIGVATCRYSEGRSDGRVHPTRLGLAFKVFLSPRLLLLLSHFRRLEISSISMLRRVLKMPLSLSFRMSVSSASERINRKESAESL